MLFLYDEYRDQCFMGCNECGVSVAWIRLMITMSYVMPIAGGLGSYVLYVYVGVTGLMNRLIYACLLLLHSIISLSGAVLFQG